MKKIFSALILFTLIFALAACAGKKDDSQETPESAQPSATAPEQEDKGIFSSVKDALDKSIPIKCKFVDPDGANAIAYIKKGEIRMEVEKNNDSPATHVIVRDEKMYMWAEGESGGLMVDFSKKTAGVQSDINSADDLLGVIEERKEDCSREVVSDSIFEVPGDVQFAGF